jgi:two-component sensor histidine kinase
VKKTLIIALSDSAEREKAHSILVKKLSGYTVSYADPGVEPQVLLYSQPCHLLLTDYEFGGGSFADFALLWSIPFIFIADIDETEKLWSTLHHETGTFLVRDRDELYLQILPLMTEKQLHYKEAFSIQNSYILHREKLYFTLVQSLPDIIFHLDAEGRISFINDAVKKLGCTPQHFIEKHVSALLQKCQNTPGFEEMSTSACYYETGEEGSKEKVGIIRDIREQHKKEKELERSNLEKEKVLRELHHRTRNNLQLILSLMRLHGDHYGNGKWTTLLEQITTEVQSIALAHEQLYGSQHITEIDIRDYLQAIAQELLSDETDSFQLHCSGDAPTLSIQKAVLAGLIISELLMYAKRSPAASQNRVYTINISGIICEGKPSSVKIEFTIPFCSRTLSTHSPRSDMSTTNTSGSSDQQLRFSTRDRYDDTQSLDTALIEALLEQLKGVMTINEISGELKGAVDIPGGVQNEI